MSRAVDRTLKLLSDQVLICLDAIDAEMKKPSDANRGKRIATICNALEMVNDQIRYGELGVDFRNDDKKEAIATLLAKAARI